MKQFSTSSAVFLHGSDRPLLQGEILRQSDLAATIRRMQKHGPREFYEGETARRIAEDVANNGGAIRLEDLQSYQAKQAEPLKGSYRGYPILTAPPSTSGGVSLLQMLNILENFPAPLGGEGSSASRHLMVEAMRRAYADRVEHAADPAFFQIPVEKLVSKDYARELASGISAGRAGSSGHATNGAGDPGGESQETTHFSVVDRNGNLVANTYTLNGFFGSQVIAAGTGVLLNDIMSAFSVNPGRNQVGPGKRPISSMTPAILLRPDGSPWLALGSPGAVTIPGTVMQTVVNLVDFKMSLRDAIEYPRIHHQNHPDRIDAEPGALVQDAAEKIRSLGHTINPKLRSQGDVHAAGIAEDGWRIGWSDGRRGGRAAGY